MLAGRGPVGALDVVVVVVATDGAEVVVVVPTSYSHPQMPHSFASVWSVDTYLELMEHQ